jgi:hypothetical protein
MLEWLHDGLVLHVKVDYSLDASDKRVYACDTRRSSPPPNLPPIRPDLTLNPGTAHPCIFILRPGSGLVTLTKIFARQHNE